MSESDGSRKARIRRRKRRGEGVPACESTRFVNNLACQVAGKVRKNPKCVRIESWLSSAHP